MIPCKAYTFWSLHILPDDNPCKQDDDFNVNKYDKQKFSALRWYKKLLYGNEVLQHP